MRTLLSLALVLLVACGRDRRDAPAGNGAPPSSSIAAAGPDPLVLRVPRAGGVARVFGYPRLDSALWTSGASAPALARVLAFDDDAGTIAYVTAKGDPGRIDLRRGSLATSTKAKLTGIVSADGDAIYGLSSGAKPVVTRLTRTGSWSFAPPLVPRAVFPLLDGTILVTGQRDGQTIVWKVRPPEERVLDSAIVSGTRRGLGAATGNGVYLVDSAGLIGVRGRDMKPGGEIALAGRPVAIVPTPSGDRLYVAVEGSAKLSVIDRFTERTRGEVELPHPATDLRMDALGRYLLAHAEGSDSVWIVAIGTDRVIGGTTSRWLPDLPFVAPDGAVALARGQDVVFVDGETLRPRATIADGAKDFWYPFFWNGLRPRAAGLDEPVAFQTGATDSAFGGVPLDSTLGRDSTGAPIVPPQAADTARAPRPAPAAAPATTGWMVSFAALLAEDKARELASRIAVEGQHARVVTSTRTGTPIFRVVLGPYGSRAEAEKAGQQSGQNYWVFEGTQ